VGASNVMVARTSMGNLPALLDSATKLELSVGDVVCIEDDALVHVPLLNVPDWSRCAREIDRVMAGAVAFVGPYAVVSVVGYGLTGASGALAKVIDVLGKLGAPAVALAAGPLRISATIDRSKLDDAQRALHAAFVV